MPSDSSFDSQVHLTWSDISVDVPSFPTVMGVAIKASKMDPFRKGIIMLPGQSCAQSLRCWHTWSPGGVSGWAFISGVGR